MLKTFHTRRLFIKAMNILNASFCKWELKEDAKKIYIYVDSNNIRFFVVYIQSLVFYQCINENLNKKPRLISRGAKKAKRGSLVEAISNGELVCCCP